MDIRDHTFFMCAVNIDKLTKLKNGALTLKGEPKLISVYRFGLLNIHSDTG